MTTVDGKLQKKIDDSDASNEEHHEIVNRLKTRRVQFVERSVHADEIPTTIAFSNRWSIGKLFSDQQHPVCVYKSMKNK